jgi:hypothetical protein
MFRMMQESIRENGIEFAHRNVTVYLPPEGNAVQPGEGLEQQNTGDQGQSNLAGAAAATAAAAIQAEEDAKLKAGPSKK